MIFKQPDNSQENLTTRVKIPTIYIFIKRINNI
jgi:hypothetical protein